MFRYRIGVFSNFKPGFNKIVTNIAKWSVASHRVQVALITQDEMNVFYLAGKCSVKVNDSIVVGQCR